MSSPESRHLVQELDEVQWILELKPNSGYPKCVIVAFLTARPVNSCFRPDSNAVVDCPILNRLIDDFELIPRGGRGAQHFLGRDVLDASGRMAAADHGRNKTGDGAG